MRLAMLFIRAVAVKTAVGQNRADVLIESEPALRAPRLRPAIFKRAAAQKKTEGTPENRMGNRKHGKRYLRAVQEPLSCINPPKGAFLPKSLGHGGNWAGAPPPPSGSYSALDNQSVVFKVPAHFPQAPYMSALFLKRFFQSPMQVASIIPSSRTLIRKVSDRMDFSAPRIIAEYGPGEGCHTREILQRMGPDSHLLLFELDEELAAHLKEQFAADKRVTVLATDCCNLNQVLTERGLPHCDYIVSGIPFSILDPAKKLRHTFEALKDEAHAAFIIYQVTNELAAHCRHFPRVESEYCLQNLPPMFVTKYYKLAKAHVKAGTQAAQAASAH
jgi:phospholipid N-methyltransferase